MQYFLILTSVLICQLPVLNSVKILLSIGIAFELYTNEFLLKIGFKYLYVLGGLIQKYLTTLEPNESQIEVGIVCLKRLLEENENIITE